MTSPPDAKQLCDMIAGRPLTSSEILDMLTTGCTYEQAKARSAERDRICKAADAIEGTPLEKWPPFTAQWDIDPAAIYWAFDGADPATVDAAEFTIIPDVPLANIDAALTPYWWRTADEVWTVGDKSKTARVIVHWSEGNLMTPPFLVLADDSQGAAKEWLARRKKTNRKA